MRIFLWSCLLLFLAGCSKKNDTVTTPETSTTPETKTATAWHLTGISINGTTQGLTTAQNRYVMSLSTNGIFYDTDGASGSWRVQTGNTMIIRKTNLPTPLTLQYTIVLQTSSTLVLKYTSVSGDQIELNYYAG